MLLSKATSFYQLLQGQSPIEQLGVRGLAQGILTYSFQATYCSMSTMFLPHYSTLPPYPYPVSMFIWYSTLTRPWTL